MAKTEEQILNEISEHLDKKELSIEALTDLMIHRLNDSKGSWLLKVGESLYQQKLKKNEKQS